MWNILYNLALGVTILPIGLMLTAGGAAGLWYILTHARPKMRHAILVISPIQTALGIIFVYKSYQYLLLIFGINLPNWL